MNFKCRQCEAVVRNKSTSFLRRCSFIFLIINNRYYCSIYLEIQLTTLAPLVRTKVNAVSPTGLQRHLLGREELTLSLSKCKKVLWMSSAGLEPRHAAVYRAKKSNTCFGRYVD